MKKLMLLFGLIAFVSLGFVSCSGDDDGGEPQDNPNSKLYATWKSVEKFENGILNDNLPCSKIKEYKFNSNKTFTLKTFVGEDNTNCNDLSTTNGTWEYKGNDNYLIYLNNENVNEQNESNYTYHLSFNNGELKWRKSEGDANFTRFAKQ